MKKYMNTPIWLALDNRGKVKATWYLGCVQPFAKWRKAAKGLGYKPIHAEIWY